MKLALKEKAKVALLRHPKIVAGATGAATVALSSVPVFAAEGATGGSGNLGEAAITSDMLSPLVDGVTSNIGVILPVGVALLAIFIGIKLIPKVLSYFF